MRRLLASSLAVATAAGLAIAAPADADPVPDVPIPTVIGPVPDEVGDRGEPWFEPPFTLHDAQPYPYVAEEFFIDGEARNLRVDDLDEAATADYRTRILVVRPTADEHFSDTVVVEWDNVTAQAQLNPLWMWNHPYLMREGHAFVSVSAQKVGTDDGSPLAHTNWDPDRYGSLHHPGDTFSYDIYAQVVAALKANATTTGETVDGVELPTSASILGPLDTAGQTVDGETIGDLKVIATGTSQSSGRLLTYLNEIEEVTAANIDGFLLDAGGSKNFPKAPVDPTIDFDSEDQISSIVPNVDGESLLGLDNDYRLWEVPASSHADAEFSRYIEDGLYGTHLLDAPQIPWAKWDARRADYTYGNEGVTLRTTCQPLGYGDNTYPRRYAARAAMDSLVRWVRTGDRSQAIQPPRVQFSAGANGVPFVGGLADAERDPVTRQIIGGVRLPHIDVPVADYVATNCLLFGQTVSYSPAQLAALYPGLDVYAGLMEEAIVEALGNEFLLPADAEEIRGHVAASTIPVYDVTPVPGHVDEGAALFVAGLMAEYGS